MNKGIFLLLLITTIPIFSRGQDTDEIRALLNGEFRSQLDTVHGGESFIDRIRHVLTFADNAIASKIGRDIFKGNYMVDYIEVFWAEIESDRMILNSTFADEGVFAKDKKEKEIENIYKWDRIIFRYNINYKSILNPKRGFTLYLEVAGNKSQIKFEGLVKLTPDRNLNNILTKDEFVKKLKKTKLDKDVRQFVKENITADNIGLDDRPIPFDIFYNLYYYFTIEAPKESTVYRFDPWTGALASTNRSTFK